MKTNKYWFKIEPTQEQKLKAQEYCGLLANSGYLESGGYSAFVGFLGQICVADYLKVEINTIANLKRGDYGQDLIYNGVIYDVKTNVVKREPHNLPYLFVDFTNFCQHCKKSTHIIWCLYNAENNILWVMGAISKKVILHYGSYTERGIQITETKTVERDAIIISQLELWNKNLLRPIYE